MLLKKWFNKKSFNNYELDENTIYKCNTDLVCEEKMQGYCESVIEELRKIKAGKIYVLCKTSEINLDYNRIITRTEKVYIEKAINYLKNNLKTIDVTILTDKNSLDNFSDIIGISKVLKVKNKDLYNIDNYIKSICGNSVEAEKFIIRDLLTLVYMGRELELMQKSVIVAVYGDAIDGNRLVEVPYGTTYKEIFKDLNGDESKLNSIILGGVLTGKTIYDLNQKVEPYDKSLIFSSNIKNNKELPCIRCGKCLEVCPKGINPIKLTELSRKKEYKEFLGFAGLECIDCGICSSICPSNIELSHNIKMANKLIEKR